MYIFSYRKYATTLIKEWGYFNMFAVLTEKEALQSEIVSHGTDTEKEQLSFMGPKDL